MKKIIAVPGGDYRSCSGCVLSDKGCEGLGTKRNIKGVAYDCLKDRIIYKEEEIEVNEMPELKAGMIVDYDGHGFLLCLPKRSGAMGFYKSNLYGAEEDLTKIKAIYINDSGNHYKAVFDDGVDKVLKPIWSRKPGNDIKIEALEQTIKTAMKQIEELKK
jgi:hypothetical protein